MGRTQEVSIRIPRADSVDAAIDWIRAYDTETDLDVEVTDDGQVTVRRGTALLATSAHLRGRIVEDGAGPVLTGLVHKSSNGLIWPWMMGLPAALLAVCSTGTLLLNGFHPGPAFIGLPGAAALGGMLWVMLRQNQEHFMLDVGLITAELTELFSSDFIDDEPGEPAR